MTELELLGRYREVFSDVPGNTMKVVMKIEIGDNAPFKSSSFPPWEVGRAHD